MIDRLNKMTDRIKSVSGALSSRIDVGRPCDGHYQARYEAYLREGIIDPRLNNIFFDEYDELPQTLYVSLFAEDALVGGVRIKVMQCVSEASISTQVYGTQIAERLGRCATAIDVSRMFTVQRPGAPADHIQFSLLRAVFKCAERYGVDYVLAPVKAGHIRFYVEMFGFDLVAEPIAYPGLSRPIGLTAADCTVHVPRLNRECTFLSPDFPGVAAADYPDLIQVAAA